MVVLQPLYKSLKTSLSGNMNIVIDFNLSAQSQLDVIKRKTKYKIMYTMTFGYIQLYAIKPTSVVKYNNLTSIFQIRLDTTKPIPIR